MNSDSWETWVDNLKAGDDVIVEMSDGSLRSAKFVSFCEDDHFSNILLDEKELKVATWELSDPFWYK